MGKIGPIYKIDQVLEFGFIVAKFENLTKFGIRAGFGHQIRSASPLNGTNVFLEHLNTYRNKGFSCPSFRTSN